MTITGFSYLLLCVLAFAVSLGLQDRNALKKRVMTLLSYYFYMTLDWRFGFLLFGLTGLNYLAGHIIANSEQDLRRKLALSIAVTGSLLVLFYFKYLNFFAEAAYGLMAAFGFEGYSFSVEILLPVGISFICFQGITYPIDLYRKQLKHTSSFADFCLFMAFFPQLLSGPIVRASFFLPQLESGTKIKQQDVLSGLTLVIRGLIKKLVFADVLAVQLVNPAFNDPTAFTSTFLLLALFAYSFQIYMDLSGYTDMALGVGRMLGYQLPVNFNRPYLATSISNYWQRWHISMSSFFRDYLYEWASGWRWSNVYLNLLIVFVAIGLWHGAGWNFVVYGCIHGTLVGLEHFASKSKASGEKMTVTLRGLKLARRIALVFLAVVLTRTLFRADDLSSTFAYFSAILSSKGTAFPLHSTPMAVLIGAALLHFTPIGWRDRLMEKLSHSNPIIIAGLFVLAVMLGAAFSDQVTEFVYFGF